MEIIDREVSPLKGIEANWKTGRCIDIAGRYIKAENPKLSAVETLQAWLTLTKFLRPI
jgi:hypothetical protein